MKQGQSSDIGQHAAEGSFQIALLLYASFVLTGVVNTMLGSTLPVLSERWSMSDAQGGYLFAGQFLASLFGAMASTFLASRIGARLSLAAGWAMMALGTAGLSRCCWMTGLVAVSCFGLGLGLTIPIVNLLVGELNPGRRAAALNLVNFAWGVGAVGCPFVVAALRARSRTESFFLGVAGLLILCVALGLAFLPDWGGRPTSQTVSPPQAARSGSIVPILAAIFFLYVGSESSVGGWSSSYARRVMATPRATWLLMPSFFWGALLAGRAVAPVFLRRVAELKLATGGLVMGILGIVGLLITANAPELAISLCLVGLGMSSVYPIAISIVSREFQGLASHVASLLFAMAGLGGAVLPWLVGYTSTRLASLRLALCVPLFGCAGLLILYLLLARRISDRELRAPLNVVP